MIDYAAARRDLVRPPSGWELPPDASRKYPSLAAAKATAAWLNSQKRRLDHEYAGAQCGDGTFRVVRRPLARV